MSPQENAPQRFYSLDVLRGLAALGIVFWHWPHFYFSGHNPPRYEPETLPLYSVLFLFYRHGSLAVDLFFSLSGFVFHWLYAESVARGSVSAWDFCLRRFSRLYPLHLATLLVVAAGQVVFRNLFGMHFIYDHNDAQHFALNLLFASSWGMEKGFSFNAPIWSVSVEVLLYAFFFVLWRKLRPRVWLLVLLSALGFLFGLSLYRPLGRGIGSFFLGGAVYFAYRWLSEPGRIRPASTWLAALTAVFWAATVLSVRSEIVLPLVTRFDWFLEKFFALWPRVVLFPLTIVSLALLETRRGSLGKRLAFLGDVSYSSYLLQFPLQLGVTMVVLWFSLDRALFHSPLTLLAFYAVLLPLSLASYRYFEHPVQGFLRRQLGGRLRGRAAPQRVS